MIIKIIITILVAILVFYEAIVLLSFFLPYIFPEIRYSKFYYILQKISFPFRRIFCGKLIVGMFDFGGTLGLILLGSLISLLVYLYNFY